MCIIENFRLDLELRQLRAHTIESYMSNVNHFLRHNPDFLKVDRNKLKIYLQKLQRKRLSNSTIKTYFIAIHSFYEYLMYEGIVNENPIIPFRKRYLPKRHRKDTRQEISLNAAKVIIRSSGFILDRTLHLLFAKTGLRRGELLSLQLEDLDLKEYRIIIQLTGKRTEFRPIYFDDEFLFLLLDYLEWRQSYAKSNYLFINPNTGKKMHKDYPGSYLKKIGLKMGIHEPNGPMHKKLTPHCWRYFFTTQLYRSGMDYEYIQYLRGDVMATQSWQIYNHIDPEHVREEYLRCIPKLLE